jgi:nucleoside-diphosphate-sugar epimerase
MAEHREAVVVGALGVIGRYIVARLIEQGEWSVVGLSRRSAEPAPRYRHIAVDLLDAEETAEKLGRLRDATHVFYAAFRQARQTDSGGRIRDCP